MKKVLVILLLITLCINLIACSDTSKFQDKDLYNDSKNIYNIINKSYETDIKINAKDSLYIDEYEEKYEKYINTEEEVELESKLYSLTMLCILNYESYIRDKNNIDFEKNLIEVLDLLKEVYKAGDI